MQRLPRVEGADIDSRFAAADVTPWHLADALRYLVVIALVSAAYFLGGLLGLALAVATEPVSAIWPPAGIALAALLVLGFRVWPGVFLGALFLNALSTEPLLVMCCVAAGNTATGLIGATVLRKLRFDAALERSSDVVSLLAVTLGCALVSATLGTTLLLAGSVIGAADYSAAWWIWWTGDSLGILIAAPLILTWASRPRISLEPAAILEFLAYVAVTALVGISVFVGPSDESPFFYPRAYVAFPLLAWAGLRLGPRGTALGVAIIATLAIWGSFHGHGPFSRWGLDIRYVILDTFLATVGCTALLVASVIAERQRARVAAREAYAVLEARVRERTADLAAAVEELGKRNQEKEILLREIHHRVKNNLQVVCSLLNLQAQDHDEPKLRAFASDCMARVRSMALVHEHLYQSHHLQGVPFAKYVGALVQEVVHAQRVSGSVEVDFDIRDDIALPVEQAIPCGLIANELVTNALKHGFPDGRAGRVILSIDRSGFELIELRVSDNGVGIADTVSVPEHCGFGLTLVTMLVDQLQGTLQIERRSGTRVRVQFPSRE